MVGVNVSFRNSDEHKIVKLATYLVLVGICVPSHCGHTTHHCCICPGDCTAGQSRSHGSMILMMKMSGICPGTTHGTGSVTDCCRQKQRRQLRNTANDVLVDIYHMYLRGNYILFVMFSRSWEPHSRKHDSYSHLCELRKSYNLWQIKHNKVHCSS